MILWLNGALIEAEQARIAPTDRGVTLGEGLFETICARDGAPLRLEAHLARLRAGAEFFGIPVPATDTALENALCATLKENGLTDGVLRLTLTGGTGPRGLLPPKDRQPTLMITAGPLPPPLPPARLIIATVTRRNEHSPLSRFKTTNYLDGILARREAEARGADDAILLNTQGRIAEASAANLFAVIDGTLITPPVEEGALPGTMRATILHERSGVERPLTVQDLQRASEVFLTSSLGVRKMDLKVS